MDLNSLAMTVKLGLSDGSADQHLSINDFHSGSHDSGMSGRSVLLTIPPKGMSKFDFKKIGQYITNTYHGPIMELVG